MRCDVCQNEMTPLFFSAVCDHCDGLRTPAASTGWIVWRRRLPGAQEYVFRTPEDARRWRRINGLDDCPIRQVRTETEIRWRRSIGSVRDLEFADRLFEIYTDPRYEPAPYRAHLA